MAAAGAAPQAKARAFNGIHGPSDEVIEAWPTEGFALHLLFEYVGLGQASIQGICGALGLDAGEGMELFGNISPSELEEFILSYVTPLGHPMTFGEKAKLRTAHQVVARISGVQHTTTPMSYHIHNHGAASTAAPPTPPLQGKTVGTIVLSNYVSQVDSTEVKIMDRAPYREGLKVYKLRLGGRGPTRGSTVSIEQYTAFIVVVVDLDKIYVDLAVWGPHADRIIKSKAFMGGWPSGRTGGTQQSK